MNNESISDLIEAFAEHYVGEVPVLVDSPDADFALGEGGFVGADSVMRFETKAMTVKTGDVIRLRDFTASIPVTASYTVRQVRKVEDGKVTVAGLLRK